VVLDPAGVLSDLPGDRLLRKSFFHTSIVSASPGIGGRIRCISALQP